MTDQPPNAQPDKAAPKTAANPAARLPAVIATPQRSGDALARTLSIVALASSLSLGVYITLHPAPPPPAAGVTTQAWQAVRQREDAMAQEIAALRQNLQTLSTQPAPPTTSTPSGPAAPADMATVEQLRADATAIASLRDELVTLKNGINAAKTVQQEMIQLKNDLAVANTAISAVHGHVQKMTASAHEAAAAEETTRAQVIAYLQLRNVAATATPFADELQKLAATAKTVPDLPGIVAKLENAAHGGVATLPMLQSRFSVMAGPAEQAVELAAAKTWWDKLAANMQEVVSIRKIDRDGTDSPGKALHNAAAALQRGNIVGAIAQVETLPPVAQTHLQEWLVDAKARVTLDAALAQIGVLLGQSTASHPTESTATEPSAPEKSHPESGTP